jgi:cysteine desulfurase
MDEEMKRLGVLRDLLRRKLEERFNGITFNTHPDYNLPSVLNISFDSSRAEVDGEVLLLGLDLKGIAVSNGSACTSGSLEPSHVLLAMGRDTRTASASLRFSLGRSNTESDVEDAVNALAEVVDRNVRVLAR